MKIALISGSPRAERNSHQVTLFIESLLTEKSIQTQILDVIDYKNGNLSAESFSQGLKEADGIIIVSPEYNGLFPGELKTMLDTVNLYSEKPAMVAGVSTGVLGGVLAAKALQQYLVKMEAYLYPKFIISPSVESLFVDQKVVEGFYKNVVTDTVNGFVSFCQKLKD
ncbi:MAG: hypothetical protein C4K58_01740 [Flavobacteriaceae bacterium]|nr:MAG: hypothetical protein C4K58_01740 [Flavobacteriaceae bacterium]